jgi:TRAP-type C4-dicarboxylate transport system substrate-binding protein
VHKIILLSGHSYALGVLGINDAFYNQLSNDERAAVDAAASNAIAFNRESSRKAEQDAFPALRAAGVEFIELVPEQKKKFRTIIQGSVVRWLRTRINAPSLIDEVLSVAQEAQ